MRSPQSSTTSSTAPDHLTVDSDLAVEVQSWMSLTNASPSEGSSSWFHVPSELRDLHTPSTMDGTLPSNLDVLSLTSTGQDSESPRAPARLRSQSVQHAANVTGEQTTPATRQAIGQDITPGISSLADGYPGDLVTSTNAERPGLARTQSEVVLQGFIRRAPAASPLSDDAMAKPATSAAPETPGLATPLHNEPSLGTPDPGAALALLSRYLHENRQATLVQHQNLKLPRNHSTLFPSMRSPGLAAKPPTRWADPLGTNTRLNRFRRPSSRWSRSSQGSQRRLRQAPTVRRKDSTQLAGNGVLTGPLNLGTEDNVSNAFGGFPAMHTWDHPIGSIHATAYESSALDAWDSIEFTGIISGLWSSVRRRVQSRLFNGSDAPS
ncbi:hypothetical protein H4R34_004435 [Dimargaris verticillata]|uniref:Uncharacterized protein n=1 Tax=Dimargaris verticillata TaxID=2761393 RepID=A0A9W8E782_9FUNG|nr:hypothetical protein H4R34_004435 [Dimargaris verticillata]